MPTKKHHAHAAYDTGFNDYSTNMRAVINKKNDSCSLPAPEEKGIPKAEHLKIVTSIREEERARIGHELHDGINPLLAVAKLYLKGVHANTDSEKYAKEQIGSVIETVIENIRCISSRLVISGKPHTNIVQLIQNLVEKISNTGFFKIYFEHSSATQLAAICPYTKLALYRIVQEQLNNVIRHSSAQAAQVKLFLREKELTLDIIDDGIGFDTRKKRNGIGLSNIISRVSQLNGFYKIKSAPGKGCSLSISLPVS